MDGGAEKVLINLVNNLDKKKYDITVQTLFDYGVNKKNLNPEIKYKYIFKKVFRGNKHFLKLFSPRFLFKRMIKEHYDIIVSYLEGPTTRIVSGCLDKKTRIINWVHTEMKSLNEFSSSYRNIKELEKSYKRYDTTVFVAETTLNNFEEKTKLNLKNKLIIRNVIDSNEILKMSNEELNEYKKNTTMITLARLTKSKGYDRLLRIHKRLLDEGIQNELWILGEGKEKNNIEDFINRNNLHGSIKLFGYKENPYKYIKKADFYVCSSYIEGYSTSVTEAIILGKPIVTTRCSGMDEILENGNYGIIVENDEESLYNGIKKVLLDKDLRKKYENLSIKRSDFFNTKKQIKQYEKVF